MCIDLEFGLKTATVIISLVVFIKGVYEYAKAQKWKKAEFVSKEIKEFFSDFDIKRALVLLDWNCTDLELKTNEIKGRTSLYFDDDLIFSALQTHKEKMSFTDEEVVIKAIFDSLFDRLTMFDNYIETGLIKAKDIKPYLIYYIKILADTQNDRKSSELRNQIWEYIDEYGYGYDKIRAFCNKLGYKNN